MIYPKFIKENDTVGITAPSDGIIEDTDLVRLDCAIENMQKKYKLKVIETKNVRHSKLGRSSTAKDRAKQLEALYKEDIVKAIFCVSGGDFLVEMLPCLDFELIKQNPKWIQGYSDPTSLLFIITTNLDIATIYGSNFKAFGMKIWHQSLKDNLEIVKGNIIEQNSFDKYEGPNDENNLEDVSYLLNTDVYWKNLKGEKQINIRGRMIGRLFRCFSRSIWY